MSRINARLEEMRFLAKLDREGAIYVDPAGSGGPPLDSPERQMMISMLRDEYVNGPDAAPGVDSWLKRDYYEHLDTAHSNIVYPQLRRLRLGDAQVELRISHKGRVRLSELEQQLRTGRDRDPTRLCVARRHLLTDLAIAILATAKDTPLSVVFLDMNGLKAINDTHGHRAGDEAIHAYLEAAVAAFGEHGEAYRGDGGDEVVVLLPGATPERSGKLLDSFVRQLGKDVLLLGDAKIKARLTASCGSVGTTDPNEDAEALLERADAAQYRAKAESKKQATRVSAFAVGDGEVITYAPG